MRIFGDDLKCYYRGSANALSVSVDGGAWSTVAITTSASTILSINLLPGGTTDDWHDVRFRLRDGFSGGGGFRMQIANGIEVTSTGGVAALEAHSDYGQHERTLGTHATTYWRSTFSSTAISGSSNFTSPIFPGAQIISGSSKPSRNAYIEFLVDTNTTKCYPFIKNGGSTGDAVYGLLVDGVRIESLAVPATTNGSWGLAGPITIPGTGTRLVRLTNTFGIDAVVIDGSFVSTAVTEKLINLGWTGDSVGAGDSVTSDGGGGNAYDATGNFDQLCEVVDGRFVSHNRCISGHAVAAFNSNSRQNDLPADLDFVICNMCINDVANFVASYAATVAAYVTMYDAILTRCPDATLLCVPQLPYQATNRATAIAGIQEAVTTVDDPRCVYVSSDNWVSSLNSGSHPRDMGKAQCCGGGVAAIRVTAQPSDGDTVTINGTVFEFDNNASVSGANTAVTIAGTLVETIENLAVAIDAASGFELLERIIISTDTTNQGVAISGCTSLAKSGTNLTVYGPEAEGWLTMLETYLASGGGSVAMLPLIGLGPI